MKLSQIEYKRPDRDAILASYRGFLESFDAAKNADEQIAVYNNYIEFQKHLTTLSSLAYIRFTLDTEDPFYSSEIDFYDENAPVFEEYGVAFADKMLASPFRAELERRLSPLLFKNYEIAKKAFSPAAVAHMQEDNRLCTAYKKLLSSAQIEFEGQTFNLPQLGKFKEHRDRALRRGAFEAQGRWMQAHAEEFDDLYDRMVRVRDAAAKKCGYENYVPLGYYKMGRNCYGSDDVARFREQVLTDWVPFVSKLRARQASALGIDRVMLYDDTVWRPQGNPEPHADVAEMFESGKRMYREMSPDTGEFIDYMLDHELLDVLSRPKKSGGGYCTELPEYGMPFIFANFNGTYGDVDVLTHEAGHAYASYRAMRSIPLYELMQGGMETCEVHSMSMEFFAWKWMERFFGAEAGAYRQMHLSNAIAFLPYGTMVDAFQQTVYEQPSLTPAQRKTLWLELEKRFRPDLITDGIPYLEEGTRWQVQSHIFERPFYYIDYCLAQTVAFDFLIDMHADHAAAFEKYRAFLNAGGSATFTDLVRRAGFASPFEDGALRPIAAKLEAILERLP